MKTKLLEKRLAGMVAAGYFTRETANRYLAIAKKIIRLKSKYLKAFKLYSWSYHRILRRVIGLMKGQKELRYLFAVGNTCYRYMEKAGFDVAKLTSKLIRKLIQAENKRIIKYGY